MKTVKLSDVCDISSGGTPSRNNPEFFKGDIPWAKISDIEAADNGFIYTTDECITASGLKNIRGKLFPKGTLLFAMYGSIGKVAFAGTELSANQAILGIRPKVDARIDLKYLKCWFESNKQRLINQGQGVALKNLSATIVRNLEIELPPFDDQNRTAHLLGKVEGLIARRKQHLQQLDDLLKSVFLEMFGDPLRNEEGWEVQPLGSLSEVQGGLQVTSKRSVNPVEVPYLRVANIYRDRLDLTKIKTIRVTTAELERVRLRKGDLLIVEGHGNPEEIGRSAVWDGSIENCVHQNHLIRVRVDISHITALYTSYFINSAGGRAQMFKAGKTTSGLNTISSKNVKETQIPKPPIDLQNHFGAIVEKVEGLRSLYQQSLTDMESLYVALSQKAFKGELNLSRVVLPAEGPEIAEEETIDVEEKQPMEPLFELPAPEELALLQTTEGRKSLLGDWLTAWLAQLGNAPFAAQAFMDAARQRLWELVEDGAPDWGAAEYDELKAWLFAALEQGRLIQGYDDANNRIQITAAKG